MHGQKLSRHISAAGEMVRPQPSCATVSEYRGQVCPMIVCKVPIFFTRGHRDLFLSGYKLLQHGTCCILILGTYMYAIFVLGASLVGVGVNKRFMASCC